METVEVKGKDSRKTLLECLSSIVEKTAAGAEDEKKFNPNVYEDAKEDIAQVGAVLGTTPRETVIFANILEQSSRHHVGVDDVAMEMGITYVKSLTYETELESLEGKKLIRRNEDNEILVPTAPILLFNEADAIFGIRQEGATRAVDKMENSIQNIILQEMEKLDGILIATTNLTTNLDKAFERRFL